MLPTEDAAAVGEEMQRRFGLRDWQFTLSATDANRFVIRIARQITGRLEDPDPQPLLPRRVDETVANLVDGEVRPREGSVGPPVRRRRDHAGGRDQRPRGARARARRRRRRLHADRAGADQHRHRARRRRLPRAACASSPATHGHAAGDRRDPHPLLRARAATPPPTASSPTSSRSASRSAAAIPTGAYGISAEVADRIIDHTFWREADVGGVGGTLAGNALSLAAVRATLAEVLTEEAFERMIALAERFEAGGRRDDRRARAALVDHPARLPRRVHVLADAAAHRGRGRGGDGRGARRAPAPLHAQPRGPDDPVPHDGADVAGDHRGAGRPPHARRSARRPPSSPVAEPPVAAVAAAAARARARAARAGAGDRGRPADLVLRADRVRRRAPRPASGAARPGASATSRPTRSSS